jgi:23S rRNA (uracil1939-C5)-methyltransferase
MKEQILRELLTRGGVSTPAQIEVLSGNPWAYRNRIRLAMTPAGELAYRSRRSHDLIPVRECPIAAPILFQTAQILREHLGTAPIPITELELFTNPDQSRLLITLFCEEEPEANPQRWLDERNAVLSAVLPTPTAGLRLQRSDGALIPKILASSGETSLTYSAANFLYRVDHGAFFQVNRWLIDEFLCRAITGLEGQTAWDLYAGVGLFARQLSHSFSQVIAVESAPASTAALRFNLEGTNAQAVASTTLDYLRHNREQRQPRPDLILLDPPRAGLGEQVTTLLNAIGAPAITYVSCDPTTLARDLRALTQERYQIDKITLVDLFPQTFHLETVVHLRRS